jgi:SecD/SecF fusion protein
VRKLLQGVARLEFWRVAEPQAYAPALSAINELLLQERRSSAPAPGSGNTEPSPALQDTTKSELERQLAQAGSDTTRSRLDSLAQSMSPVFALSVPNAGGELAYEVKDTAEVNRIFKRPDIRAMIPRSIGLYWDVKVNTETTTGREYLVLNFIDLGRSAAPLLTGETITAASQDFDEKGRYAVSMKMDPAGTRVWAKVTAQEAAKTPQGRIAIVLDNYVYTAPSVNSEIPNGNSQISGNFTLEEAKDLANVLKAGSLPAPTRIVEEAIIGPTLGKIAQKQGVLSIASGLLAVVIFMIAYYSKGGWVANFALLFNVFFILGILAQLDAALTLPGIAGIVLTMGMAVDANVLIYERLREELHAGKRLREAIRLGYKGAFWSIFDSNLTTFLTAFFLYVLGSGPLKGFAITLMVGICTSFFSAVYISRVIIEWMVRKGDDAKISFETALARAATPRRKFNFVGSRKKAYLFSSVYILAGIVLMAVQGLNLGVDFKGGRSYVVAFPSAVEATAMRTALSAKFEGAGTEVKNYGSNSQVKVTTSYLVEDDSDVTDQKVKDLLVAGISEYTGLEYAEDDSGLDERHFIIGSSSKVGATVADDIKNSALEAGALAILGIFVYILIRFRKVQFSMGAIAALIHDSLFVFVTYGYLRLFGISFEIDQVFVAAMLTIIGYSINDTVIIFDRIREYMSLGTGHSRNELFNEALNNTLSRTMITGGTTLLVVLLLLIFGGEVLRGFSFSLFVGIVVGTYSSIFIATPVVIDLDRKGELEAGKVTA